MNLKKSLFGILVCLATTSQADILADGETGFSGSLSTSSDCAVVNFPNKLDTQFFKVTCLAAVGTGQILQELGASSIYPQDVKIWLNTNDLESWVKSHVTGIEGEELGSVTSWARQILQAISEGDLNSGSSADGSAYVFYKPYPSLKDKCIKNGFNRFHGSLQFLFDFEPKSGQWKTRQIKSWVVCRST